MWLWIFLLPVCLAEANWPRLSTRSSQAYRAERDIALDIPIDQQTPFGISANRLIFDVEGYTADSLATLLNVLYVGINAIMLDMYWNEYTHRWQLCPAPIPEDATANLSETVKVSWQDKTYRCQPSFADSDVYATLRDYIKSSNINSEANVVQLILNLRLIRNDTVVVRTNTTGNRTVATRPAPTSLQTGMVVYQPKYMEVGNTSLSGPISTLNSYLYSPRDLNTSVQINVTLNYDSEFPTMQDFMFNMYKRTLISAINTDFRNTLRTYNLSLADRDSIFFYEDSGFTLNDTSEFVLELCRKRLTDVFDSNYYSQRVHTTKFRTLIDSNEAPLSRDDAHNALQCGYMPVLNASWYPVDNKSNISDDYTGRILNRYIPYSYWSWGSNEPNASFVNKTRIALDQDDLRTRDEDDDDDNDVDNPFGDDPDWQETAESQVAEKCVAMKQGGWAVENCYNKYRLACKNTRNPFEWQLSEEIALYFSTNQQVCPKNFKFGIPHLSTEQLALRNFLNASQVIYPVWIDLNDITILGCFVDGGPYAECPYKRAVTTSNLIRLIAPSAVVAVVILLLIFYERFFLLTPIHSNRRRHWKRVINQYYKKNDYEGVPS